jgi:ABC-type multidrug transport system fused ATPase/permease subunit
LNALKPLLRLYRLLDSSGQSDYWKILSKSIIVILLEILGLGILYLSALIILDKGFFTQRPFFKEILEASGLTGEQFMIACLSVLVFVFVLKNFLYFFLQRSIIRGAFKIGGDFSDKRIDQALSGDEKLTNSKELAESSTLTTQISNAILIPSILFLTELVFLILSFLLVTFYKPRLSVFLMASLLPPTLFALAFYRIKLKKFGENIKDRLPDFYASLSTLIYGKNEIRLYRKSHHFTHKLKASRKPLYEAYENIQLYSSTIPHKLLETVAIGSILVLALYAYMSRDFQALAFMVALFGSVAFRMLPSINRVMTSLNTLHANEHLLDYVPAAVSKQSLMLEFGEKIHLQNIGFSYGETKVIDNLNLSIDEGDYLGIVGPNGAGKSTLAQIILGLLKPTAGSAVIRCKKGTFPIQEPVGAAAYVSQDPYLLEASIAENVAFGDVIDVTLVQSTLRKLHLGEWLEKLKHGVETHIGERGTTISGGQAQRIALARALYKNPKLLVLDEALNALDDSSMEIVLKYLKRLNMDGLTLVQIAHDKREISHASKTLHLV